VAAFESELRLCLGEILGEPAPDPDTDPLLFFRQWLAERNLGLVPIADAAAFSWPGTWLARVRAGDGDHAVVMVGSPSGALFDPSGAAAEGGTIEEGWLVAPLDPRLESDRPYGTEVGRGVVAGLLVAPAAEEQLVQVESVVAVAGCGLEGDRYGAGRGTFSGPGRGYELTLVEAEVLDELELSWARARRNVVTRGAALNPLVGRRFRLGDVECVGRRLAEPCAHLEKLAGPGLLRPLVHRAGLRADILVGGTIRVGDELVPLDEWAT
jgi:MOSC domain-containing protein YiiM